MFSGEAVRRTISGAGCGATGASPGGQLLLLDEAAGALLAVLPVLDELDESLPDELELESLLVLDELLDDDDDDDVLDEPRLSVL